MPDDQTTGTPTGSGEGADAATAASGTPPTTTAGGDAAAEATNERIRKLEEVREKYLANLETVERANEIIRQQQQEQANRAITPPTGYDPAATRIARAAQLVQGIRERDPDIADAMTELVGLSHAENQTAMQRQQAEQRFYRELGAVPSEHQAEVDRIARSEGIWPSQAHRALKADRYDKERTDLAEQRRKLQEQEERMKRGVVATTAAPAPPAPKADEITDDEYNRLIESAEKGNSDARKKLDDVDYGRIRVRSG